MLLFQCTMTLIKKVLFHGISVRKLDVQPFSFSVNLQQVRSNRIFFPKENLKKEEFDKPEQFNNHSKNFNENQSKILEARREVINTVDLAPEIANNHPIIDQNRRYVKQILRKVPSFSKPLSGLLIVNTYRYLAPAEFQTKSQLRVVYETASILELILSSALIGNGLFGPNSTRKSNNSHDSALHHVTHPKTYHLDMILVLNLASEAFRMRIPETHPCKCQIVETFDMFISKLFANHAFKARQCYHSEIKTQPNFQVNPSGLPFHLLNYEIFKDFALFRLNRYLEASFNLGRYLACYATVPQSAISEVLELAVEISSALDDLALFLSPNWEDRCRDIVSGNVNVLLCSLLDPSNFQKLAEREKSEVLTSLRHHFGTGDWEDGWRVWQLCKNFKAHLHAKVYVESKAQLLGDTLRRQAKLNFPAKLLCDSLVEALKGRVNAMRLVRLQRENEAVDDVINVLLDLLVTEGTSHF